MKTVRGVAMLAIGAVATVVVIDVYATVVDLVDSGQNLGDARTFSIALGDVDGDDGDLDAVTTHMSDGNPIWINGGTGTFSHAG
jgi:hypothetical protein